MQNIVSLLGSSGASAYLALLGSGQRLPVYQLLSLNPDRSVRADLTGRLIKPTLDRSDELGAQKATFSLANQDAAFNLFTAGPLSPCVDKNALLSFSKGLRDPATGTVYLLPACLVRVVSAVAGADRTAGTPTCEVTCLDLMKNLIKQKVTTDAYYGATPDFILKDVLTRTQEFTASTVQPTGDADGLAAFPFAQFPDMAIVDIIGKLYEPYLYAVKVGEDGIVRTAPRLGSKHGSFTAQLGFPDADAPPAPSAVSYVFPDNSVIFHADDTWNDLDSTNQVTVLGGAANTIASLGGAVALGSLSDSTIDAVSRVQQQLYFSEHGSSQNDIVAANVSVLFYFSTNHNLPANESRPPTPGSFVTHFDSSNGVVNLTAQGQSTDIYNQDPHSVGYVKLDALTPTYTIIRIEGRQFSSRSGFSVNHHGGFDYSLVISGQPQVSVDKTLTQIDDYNPVTVSSEAATNPFGDRLTYQAAHNPFAKGTPIEVSVNQSPAATTLAAASAQGATSLTLASTAGISVAVNKQTTLKLGTGDSAEYALATAVNTSTNVVTLRSLSSQASPLVPGGLVAAYASGVTVTLLSAVLSADQNYISTYARADFDRGRVVLLDNSYRLFTSDISSGTSGLTETGGSVTTNSTTWDLSPLSVVTPLALYQSNRSGNSRYVFTGLTVGQSYTVRLHFADPSSTGTNQRKFSVFVNGAESLSGYDIFAAAGGTNKAIQSEISGMTPDFAGTLTLDFTNRDITEWPTYGTSLGDCTASGNAGDATLGLSLICGIEILPSQGQAGPPYGVNCGGAAISPSAPSVSISYAYSLIQQQQGPQNLEVNNPLITTIGLCKSVCRFYLGYAAWSRNKVAIHSASVPHLQEGDIVQFYNPRQNADMWCYIESLHREGDRSAAEGDTDDYSTYLLYARGR